MVFMRSSSLEYELYSIDDEKSESAEIDDNTKSLLPQPRRYEEKSRAVCMNFCYFDRDLEVYSEVEGL